MGVPIIFLAIAPLAGIIALQLTPPFSSAAIVLSLVFSACGLVLLYKHLLLPLRTLTAAASQPCKEIPAIDHACDLVRALEDSLRAQQAAHAHAASEARAAHEELLHELQELRENRAAILQAQQAVLDVLRSAHAQLNALAVPLATGQGQSITEQWHDPQLIFKIAADLHHSERTLRHAGQFLGDVANADSTAPPTAEAFPWKDSYSTDIPVVDGQHKLLLSYINKLHTGVQNGCDKTLLFEILDDLTGYAFTHFATEEMYFTRTAYPLAAKHIEEHQQFRQTVTQLRDAVLDGKAFIDIALLEYLKTWLVEHIQRMDAGFAPYVTGALPGHK